MPTTLYTVDQVAEQMATTPRFVRRLIAERRIGFVRLGRQVRIAEEDVLIYLAGGRVEPLRPPLPRRPGRGS